MNKTKQKIKEFFGENMRGIIGNHPYKNKEEKDLILENPDLVKEVAEERNMEVHVGYMAIGYKRK